MSVDADLTTTLGGVISGGLWPSVAPARAVVPYGVYQAISGVEEMHLMGRSYMTNYRIQIDLFGDDLLALKVLAEAVKAAMDASTLFKIGGIDERDGYEDPRRFYHVSLDFSVWHRT